jgi:hypothetical protein
VAGSALLAKDCEEFHGINAIHPDSAARKCSKPVAANQLGTVLKRMNQDETG